MVITSINWKWNNGIVLLCIVLAGLLAGCSDSLTAEAIPQIKCVCVYENSDRGGYTSNGTGKDDRESSCIEKIKEYQEIERAVTYARQ